MPVPALPALPLDPVAAQLLSRLGIGTLTWGVTYPHGHRPDRAALIALVHRALDLGWRRFDAADTYCAGAGEEHFVEALLTDAVNAYAHREHVARELCIATKTGMRRLPESAGSNSWRGGATTPAAYRASIMASHAALGGAAPIALYQLHHTDGLTTEAALRAVLAEVAGLRRQGIVARIGLCNATVAQVRIALDALAADGGVHSVQNEFSLWARDAAKPLPAAGVVARTCKKGVIEFCQVHCSMSCFDLFVRPILKKLTCMLNLAFMHMHRPMAFASSRTNSLAASTLAAARNRSSTIFPRSPRWPPRGT